MLRRIKNGDKMPPNGTTGAKKKGYPLLKKSSFDYL